MDRDAQTQKPPVVVVTGPTAAGKTPLAIEIAQRFGGEIVNADSMQVFRYMDVGTAKPSLEQRALVPHHLLDVVTPDVPYSAGRYAEEARKTTAEIHARGKIVLLTGGTGLYIRAFLEGLLETGEADPELRAELQAQNRAAVEVGDPLRLHRRLGKIDPEAADRIHPNDTRRIIRALEIAGRVGEPASQLRAEHAFGDRPYRTLHLAIDPGREALIERIDRRCGEMIDNGLLREARELRERGYGPELRPMLAIGYRHMTPVVDGSDTLAHALEVMRRDTRRFARRQRSWLRQVAGVRWQKPDETRPILDAVESFLSDGGRA
ncbi:MAG: tRNA (adenosine(37)-N6)-dimethylallyltransferase MiaA [Deltaproteobacteria bacterium]|jgi:tRNA dimethylallyltransferase|nr:tRNA (adenosine(37)-N6)-dimethylallyltransferase MiaA [Deltaproteobacteria bacterium]